MTESSALITLLFAAAYALQTLSVLCDNVGACERIFKSPIPLVYTRLLSRFLTSP